MSAPLSRKRAVEKISGRTLREADRLVARGLPFLEEADKGQHLRARLDVRTSVGPCCEDIPGGFLQLIGTGDIFHSNFGNLLFFDVNAFCLLRGNRVRASSPISLDLPFPLLLVWLCRPNLRFLKTVEGSGSSSSELSLSSMTNSRGFGGGALRLEEAWLERALFRVAPGYLR